MFSCLNVPIFFYNKKYIFSNNIFCLKFFEKLFSKNLDYKKMLIHL